MATLHQTISAGVNVTTSDVKNYLYSCTSMFSQTVEIDLNISPNYVIQRGTEISPLSLYKMPNLQFGGTTVNRDKYKELLMNLLFSIRYLKAENPTHQDQLKKTIRKTKSNWNYIPWMNSIAHEQLDDVLAGYDWFLFLKETKDQPFRFGTITTQWKDMGAFRDFCFISELFPGEPTRLIKWIQNLTVAASILKMHMLATNMGDVGSSFLYCKPMGIVSKSDLSVTEHGVMHDYIHVTGALLGNARSCNSRFISNSMSRSDVCMSAMCIMATSTMKCGVQLDDDESRIINKATAKAMRLSVQEIKQIPDNVGVWIDSYNNDSARIGLWIKSCLSGAAKPCQFSVLEHLMVSHRDWVDISHVPPTQSTTNQSMGPQTQPTPNAQ